MKEEDAKKEKLLKENGFRTLDETSGEGATERFIKDCEKDLKPFLGSLQRWRENSLNSKFSFDLSV